MRIDLFCSILAARTKTTGDLHLCSFDDPLSRIKGIEYECTLVYVKGMSETD